LAIEAQMMVDAESIYDTEANTNDDNAGKGGE
jgi:hypothetical protein